MRNILTLSMAVAMVSCALSGQSQTITSTVAGNGTASFSGDGGAATAASINNPHGLCRDAAGNTYIADHGNNRIRVMGSSGTIATVAGNGVAGFSGDGGPATAASINSP